MNIGDELFSLNHQTRRRYKVFKLTEASLYPTRRLYAPDPDAKRSPRFYSRVVTNTVIGMFGVADL